MSALIEMNGITKRFGDTVAVNDVDLTLEEGEIHSLLGENGAGKTTLMKVLYGHFPPNEGEIVLEGTPRSYRSPRDAINDGIGMVHQHFMLVDPMTVAENIFLGAEPTDRTNVLVDGRSEAEQVRKLSDLYGFNLDPHSKIEDLSVGGQQRVELLKTLSRGAEVIILDEPTAVLTPQEVDELFEILRSLKDEGKSIIFITHKLNEVLELSDRITVLRDGENIGTVEPEDATKADLAHMMVGRDVLLDIGRTETTPGDMVLDIENLSLADTENVNAVRNIDFGVREGDIFGIAGVDGNGQKELVEAITGLRGTESGSIRFLGEDLTGATRRDRIESGMGYIPEDRMARGLAPSLNLIYNALLGSQRSPKFTTERLRLLWDRVRSHTETIIDRFDVRPRDPEETIPSLSGGNRQKFLVGREIQREPALLVASHPTRGVDVGSIEFIREQLLELKGDGKAVLLVSSKLDEVMQLSDRMAVMYEGEFMDIIDSEAVTEEDVGLLMMGERASTAEDGSISGRGEA